MSDEQNSLANNFASFANHLKNSKEELDFKMEVITTDDFSGRDNGNMLNSRYARSNWSAFLSQFSSTVRVGISGSGTERGLAMADAFLRGNPRWPREDADLIIVHVSDEEDHSHNDVEAYITYANSLKSSSYEVKMFSIVSELGRRYKKASGLTSGQVFDIEGNFSTILNKFGSAIKNRRVLFPLNDIPVDPSRIEVYVNDVLSPQERWTYVEALNGIQFLEDFIPEDRDKIDIRYSKKSLQDSQ